MRTNVPLCISTNSFDREFSCTGSRTRLILLSGYKYLNRRLKIREKLSEKVELSIYDQCHWYSLLAVVLSNHFYERNSANIMYRGGVGRNQ